MNCCLFGFYIAAMRHVISMMDIKHFSTVLRIINARLDTRALIEKSPVKRNDILKLKLRKPSEWKRKHFKLIKISQ